MELVEIQAGAAEAFGQADFNPLGRPVTSALEALGVHIGFDQEDGVAVTFQPVGAEALQVKAQALGSQIGPAIFGREQREPSVASYQMACGVALSVGPTDPGIAGPQMESGAGPPQQTDPLPGLLDDLPQRLANQAMLFEVVFLSDQFVPALLLFKAVDQLDRDRFGGDLAEDFGDEVFRFRAAFYLVRTNHGAEFGSLGADCFAKS